MSGLRSVSRRLPVWAGDAPIVAKIEVRKGDEWQYVMRDVVTDKMTATTDIVAYYLSRRLSQRHSQENS